MIITEKSLRKTIKSIILEMRPEPLYSDDLLFPDSDETSSDRSQAIRSIIDKIRLKVKDDPRVYVQDITEKVPMNMSRQGVSPQFPFEVYEDHELYRLVASEAYRFVTGEELLANSLPEQGLHGIVYGQEGKYEMEAPTIEELFDAAVDHLRSAR